MSDPKKYELKNFTEDVFTKVRSDWESLVEPDEFAIELEGVLDWCYRHMISKPGDSQACGIFETGSGECCAIVEIVDTKGTSTTKMLRLHLTPRLWDVDDNLLEIADVYVASCYFTIVRGVANHARRVKLYGRNDLLHRVLKLTCDMLNREQGNEDPVATFEGRWLTVQFK